MIRKPLSTIRTAVAKRFEDPRETTPTTWRVVYVPEGEYVGKHRTI